ncbi:P-loop containing nucleoside triphosphate hydrolase protein [Gigaspora rosea]|uniref:P-loop containing nucleoside triphosphate hydrolase protein n=1 Tax=Gigaspora rosea TaxID=44941 RepID=A0A397VT96_9GLOM|nr:P-loop containing nucleoside triphosphate hydrolase protein [Gigaspora rosea]
MQNNDTVEVKDTPNEDWQWPCFEEWFSREKFMMVRVEKTGKAQQSAPFKVVYSVDRDGIHKTIVEFGFQPLIKLIQDIIPGNSAKYDQDSQIMQNIIAGSRGISDRGVRILRSIVPSDSANFGKEFKVNAQHLYHVMEKLRDKRDEKSSDITSEKIYLRSLIKFLEQEYEQTDTLRATMLSNNAVSFDMLWVFYAQNIPVFYTCKTTGQWLGGIVSSTYVKFNHFNQKKLFIISIRVIDYDGVGFKRCNIFRKIEEFEGEVNFSALPVMPSQICKVRNRLMKIITENGKRFFELASEKHFKNYNGSLFRWKDTGKCMQLEKRNANGRVMIDLQSFAVMNPDYDMDNALPPNKCDVELLVDNGVYLEKDKIHQEEIYLHAPAVVYGFSFALKEWGMFEVSKFMDIQFDKDALDYLVMPQNKKEIIKGLVKQYADPNKMIEENGLDPIRKKGNGCIFLCYGPPGTGKTLTAESVAEFLERPLWMLSVHELGAEPKDLEQQLAKILEISYAWKSVLLLDEADIYLEKRNTTDLKRNMMVGVFLRLLEYYQGVLFLTTNRVVNFDDAICSRVSMFIHYTKLGPSERHSVWTNFIKRAGLSLKADNFTEYELNGREIRNVINIARALAQDKNEDLVADFVIDIINTIQNEANECKKLMNENDM